MKGKLTMDNMLGVKDVKGVLVDLLAKLTSDDWQSWLTEVKKFLRKEPCWVENVQTLFNPHVYFEARNGLRVTDLFVKRVLPNVFPMPYCGLGGVVSNLLPRDMSDKEIIHEMGGMSEVKNNPFTLAQIAKMIDSQPNGKKGELLNNRHANIFYVLVNDVVFAISVCWGSNNKWNVAGLLLDEIGAWDAGDMVFKNTTL